MDRGAGRIDEGSAKGVSGAAGGTSATIGECVGKARSGVHSTGRSVCRTRTGGAIGAGETQETGNTVTGVDEGSGASPHLIRYKRATPTTWIAADTHIARPHRGERTPDLSIWPVHTPIVFTAVPLSLHDGHASRTPGHTRQTKASPS